MVLPNEKNYQNKGYWKQMRSSYLTHKTGKISLTDCTAGVEKHKYMGQPP